MGIQRPIGFRFGSNHVSVFRLYEFQTSLGYYKSLVLELGLLIFLKTGLTQYNFNFQILMEFLVQKYCFIFS